MQIYVVWHLVVRMVPEMKLDRVALADADETAGHRAPESPEGVTNPFRDFLLHFADFELDDDLRRLLAIGGGWYVRR